MIPEVLLEILKHEGVIAIATCGVDGPHLVNTWHSYVIVTEDGRWLIPVGRMHKTEANLVENPKVLLTLGSREIPGVKGIGYLLTGKAALITSGPDFDVMKARFNWQRATLAVTIENVTQTL